MVARTLRAFGIGLGLSLALALSSVCAQTPQTSRGPASEFHAEANLAFPATLGPARKVAFTDYGKTTGNPKLGYSWHYETQALTTTFYLYNLGMASIPAGGSNAVVLQHFQQALRDIEIGAKAGRYEQLQLSLGPDNCTVGTMIFRCATFSAIRPTDKRPIFTRLFVTGYRNYFLKVRQDWLQNTAAGTRDVDAVLLALVSSAKP